MYSTGFFIPSLFTVLNLFLGFLSIVMSAQGSYEMAAWLINFAVLCDGMDGKIARWTQNESAYGYELDSLSDLVSFGVAPALLIGIAYQNGLGWPGQLFCFLYLFTGAFRLARFNVQSAGDRSDGYQGLPIPIAAMTLASLIIFKYQTWLIVEDAIWLIILFILSVLMASQIRYRWPQVNLDGNLKDKLISVSIFVTVILMSIFPRYLLFPLLVFYILKAVTVAFVTRLHKWHVLSVHINK